MRIRTLLLFVALALLSPLSVQGATPQRFAVIIGGAGYAVVPKLPSCAHSANALVAALGRVGFDVATRIDTTNSFIAEALDHLTGKLAETPGAVAIIYGCGYAIDLQGTAYFLPAFVDPRDATAIRILAVPMQRLLGAANAAGSGAVLLDLFNLPAKTQLTPSRLTPEQLAPATPAKGVGGAVSLMPDEERMIAPLANSFLTALDRPPVRSDALFAALKSHPPAGGRLVALVPPTLLAELVVPQTSHLLEKDLVPSMPDESAMSIVDRMLMQDALDRLGFYSGPSDGVFDAATRAAIRRFQQQIGANTTERLTAEQAGRLLIGTP